MEYTEYLKNINHCPFCVSEDSQFVAENETAFLTYSIAPYHPDHLLVIPKRHIEHVLDLVNQEIVDIESLQRQGFTLLHNLGYTNISFLVREGVGSGKSVAHLHYHIIPNIVLGNINYGGDRRRVLDPTEISILLSRLQSNI